MIRKLALLGLPLLLLGTPAQAAKTAVESVDEYRQMLADGNPGEMWLMTGEDLFYAKRGPNNVSLESCDFGLGAGVIEGAYAQMPRYFADTNRVEDLESRLLHCMVSLQGLERKELVKNAFSKPGRDSDMEALVAFIASKSNGMPFAVKASHTKEKEALALGEELFYRRSSVMDFACATCHRDDNKRIRLQTLMNGTNTKSVQAVMTTWPTYRVSQGTVRTMQHRMWDCHWQMRLPDIDYASDASVALIMYLTNNANGGVIDTPGIKR